MSDRISHEDQFAWIERMDDDDWNQLASFDWDGIDFSPIPEERLDDTADITASFNWPDMHSGCQDLDNRSQRVHSGNQVACLVDRRTLPSSTPAICPSASDELMIDTSSSDRGFSCPVKPHRARSSSRQKARDMKCTFAGCQHRGSFPRKYELDRHIAVKHRDEKPYTCPVVGCFKGKKAPAFARQDKLTAHLRAVHTADQPGRCVEKGCTIEFLPLDLLVLHGRTAHAHRNFSRISSDHWNAISLAHGKGAEKSPFWACRTSLKTTAFLRHTLSHSTEELNAMQGDLLAMGYMVMQNHRGDYSIMLTCPLCRAEKFDSHDGFKEHIVERHLLKQEEQIMAFWRTRNTFFKPYRSMVFEWDMCVHQREKCPFCIQEGLCDDHWESRSHDRFLRDEAEVIAELYPHRREILRKFPNFWAHPVFNDLKRTTPAEQ